MEHIPKNIRQIGGKEERVNIYMEDYVSTYLRRVRETWEENGAAGFLVGSWQQDTGVPCVFISGAIAISQVGLEGGQVSFSPEAWDECDRSLGTYFSGQELCGLFVCEGNCRRFRKQALFAAVRECFPDRQGVLYLLTEEGEEIVYRILPRAEERLQGYYCYFERNEAMQDYMVEHLPDRRVEWEGIQADGRKGTRRGHGQAVVRMDPVLDPRERSAGAAITSLPKGKEGSLGDPSDPAYRFRQKMGKKRSSAPIRREAGGRGVVALCAVMALVIVVSGMGLAYREKSGLQIRDLLNRLHIDPGLFAAVSAMPEETGEHYVGRENGQDQENSGENISSGILVEEVPGNVYPTEGETESVTEYPETTEASETTESLETTDQEETTEQAETMPADRTQPAQSSEPETEESFPVGTGVLYTVKAGDSLYSISRRFYGTEEMASVIQQMNGLENADLIKVGQELLLP